MLENSFAAHPHPSTLHPLPAPVSSLASPAAAALSPMTAQQHSSNTLEAANPFAWNIEPPEPNFTLSQATIHKVPTSSAYNYYNQCFEGSIATANEDPMISYFKKDLRKTDNFHHHHQQQLISSTIPEVTLDLIDSDEEEDADEETENFAANKSQQKNTSNGSKTNQETVMQQKEEENHKAKKELSNRDNGKTGTVVDATSNRDVLANYNKTADKQQRIERK